MSTAPRVLIGVAAGGFVDRTKRRSLMIAADLARALILTAIPTAACFHLLVLWQLYVVAFLVGSGSVIFDIENQAYFPTLLKGDELVKGNTRFSVTASIANVGGPALAGGLIQLVTAPFAIAATSLSYVVSAGFLLTIRTREEVVRVNDKTQWWGDLRSGVMATLAHPLGRPIWLMETTSGVFVSMFAALYPFIALQDLHLIPLPRRADSGVSFGRIC